MPRASWFQRWTPISGFVWTFVVEITFDYSLVVTGYWLRNPNYGRLTNHLLTLSVKQLLIYLLKSVGKNICWTNSIAEMICWHYLLRSAVEMICWDRLFKLSGSIVEFNFWDFLIICWDNLLTSAVEIICWDYLLRLSVVINCWDFLLRWHVEMNCWDYLLRFSVEISCWDYLLS